MKKNTQSSRYLATITLLAFAPYSVHAADVFNATTGNTTNYSNNNNGTTAANVSLSGATPDLLFDTDGENFFASGFGSTDDINTLKGSMLTNTDTVTITLTVDSISHTGTSELRSRGIQFGMAETIALDGGTASPNSLILGLGGSGNSGPVDLIVGTGGANSTEVAPAFTIAPSSVEDGFGITLTANSTGYTFSYTGVTASSGTLANVTGTFAPGEFESFFGAGHFYLLVQKRYVGMTTLDISEAKISIEPDSDGDGMPDNYEDATPGLNKNFGGDASQGANDGMFDDDGRTNLEEYQDGTDPNVADVDGDNLNDGEEFDEGTNPLVADTDGDLLNDDIEIYGTLNPFQDGHIDGDPPGGAPGERTDPLVADTDEDNLSDFEELDNGNGSVTNPNSIDTDGDTLFDDEEVNSGLDPNDPNGDNGADGDPDGDFLLNLDEVIEGTNPFLGDTDGDTINDKIEIEGTLNPFQEFHTPGDPPAGVPGERTNPLEADSDFDGLDDFVETDNANGSITNPNNGDTDDDTFKDLIEVEGGSLPNDFASTPTFPAISWSAQAFDEESDLSTAGTLLFADNFQGGDVTLNGILFTGRLADTGAGEFSSPNLQTFLNTSAPPVNVPGFYDDEVPALAPLISTFWFVNDPAAVNFGITGLTPGKSYLIQFGRADDRSGAIIDRYMMADSFGGGAELDPIGATNLTYGGPANPAILLDGTFTATHTVQTFVWSQLLNDDTLVGSHMAFIQVREVSTSSDVIVSDVRHNGTTVEVDFANLDPGKTYQLVRSADLQDSFPTVVDGPRSPAGATDTFTDSGPLLDSAFYQLEVMP